MPYLKINTNVSLDKDRKNALAASASTLLSQLLGKPESYIMVEIASDASIMFASTNEPAVYIELKSIGLPEADTEKLSASLCDFIDAQIGVPPDRIYIEFSPAARHLWGWNKHTF